VEKMTEMARFFALAAYKKEAFDCHLGGMFFGLFLAE
jgi:hypothetical protein